MSTLTSMTEDAEAATELLQRLNLTLACIMNVLCCRGHHIRWCAKPTTSQDPHERADSMRSQRRTEARGDVEIRRKAYFVHRWVSYPLMSSRIAS